MNYDELKKKHPELNWAEAEEVNPEDLEAAAELFDRIAKQKRQELLEASAPKEFTGEFRPTDKDPLVGFVGYLETSFEKLVSHFGLPNGEGADYKVSTKWILEDRKGHIITIYDYKETNLYSNEYPTVDKFRKRKSYQWHIGSNSYDAVQQLVKLFEK